MSQRYLGGVITANPTAPTLASSSGVWTLEQQFQYSQGIQPKIIGNSVRFRSSASASFSRTPASAGNQTTWTWSGWVKRGSLDTASYYTLFASGNNVVDSLFAFRFASATGAVNDQLWVRQYNPSTGTYDLSAATTAVYRDPSAWYHIVLVYNSTNATSTDRLIIYVNGNRQDVSYTAGPVPLNRQSQINMARLTTMGVFTTNTSINYFDGYMAEVNFIDGQALTPSSFGAFDSTGVWQPLGYTGTYGTNGFYLNFSDTSGATATTIGKDSSGNGNNWTPNNISVTSGVTYDAMIDSPTNYATGTAYGIGNYSVMNPLSSLSGQTSISAANLQLLGTSTLNSGNDYGTIGVTSGKWYWENTVLAVSGASSYPNFGAVRVLYNPSSGKYIGDTFTGGAGIFTTGAVYKEGSFLAAPTSYTTNDVIGIALDVDNLTCAFYKNGTLIYTVTGLTAGTYWAGVASYYNSSAACNFGQRPFSYTPPTGFVALNTANLPASNIPNGAQYMAATTYSGNSSTQSIVNSGNNTTATTFAPDFVWIKSRSGALSHYLNDSVRGPYKTLFSNLTNAEYNGTADSDGVSTFNSNGFTLLNGTNAANYNASGSTYVAWQWKANGTAVTNNAGSITATVSANTTAGFSIATYTGNATTNATFGHSLGVAPNMVIIKNRAATTFWYVFHSSLPATYNLYLNDTAAQQADNVIRSTSSTTVTVSSSSAVNASGQSMVAYCFAAVRGYSAFGSYTGNASTDGPFVYCGFRPRFVMVKRTDSTENWYIHDSARDTYNQVNAVLFPNLSNAEGASNANMDFTSNGFKIRENGTASNASGGTYIYAAFAENPFNTARAR